MHTYVATTILNSLTTTIIFILLSVPSEPCSLEVVSVTSSSVTLQWDPPETPNGIITQYSIHYGETVIDNFGNKASNKLMGTVEGLSPNTTYVLQLRAHTRVGPGLPRSLTIKTCKFIMNHGNHS